MSVVWRAVRPTRYTDVGHVTQTHFLPAGESKTLCGQAVAGDWKRDLAWDPPADGNVDEYGIVLCKRCLRSWLKAKEGHDVWVKLNQ